MHEPTPQFDRLAAAIRRIEGGGVVTGSQPDPLAEGAAPTAAGGAAWPPQIALQTGLVHEWFTGGTFGGTGTEPPALTLLADLADVAGRAAPWVVWVGRWCWPHPPMRPASSAGGLWGRSLFVDPPDAGDRLWASEVAARSGAVGVVVADGRGMNMAATRRLQLLAKAHHALLLLARAPNEQKTASAAALRWCATPHPAARDRPRWRVTLLRCKGLTHGRSTDGKDALDVLNTTWHVEWDSAQGRVVTPADVADRAAPPSATSDNTRAAASTEKRTA